MAATCVAVLLEGNQATLASVGDSRIYLVRDGHLSSLMIDDDLATHLIQMGQTPTQAYQTPSAAALINCVGEFQKDSENKLIPAPMKPQISNINLLPGDHLILCSDGIPDYGGIDEEDAERNIVKIISEAYTPSRAAFELITLANLGGGGDNLSCIVLRFDEILTPKHRPTTLRDHVMSSARFRCEFKTKDTHRSS